VEYIVYDLGDIFIANWKCRD